MFKELNILKVFLENPGREFNVREVARILKMSPATASKKLKMLAKEGVLKERSQKVFKLYRANLESDNYRDLKIYYSIRKIKDSGLLDALNKFYLKPAVVLFGSSAFGMDTETSDIDLLVVSENTKEFPETQKFEKTLGRELQIFIVKDVKDLKNKHLINSAANGITLQGMVKWI